MDPLNQQRTDKQLLTRVNNLQTATERVGDMARIMQAGRRSDKRRYWTMMSILGGVLLAVLLVGITNQVLARQIRSCTSPGGQCYERNLRRIVEVDLWSARCERESPTYPLYAACMKRFVSNG